MIVIFLNICLLYIIVDYTLLFFSGAENSFQILKELDGSILDCYCTVLSFISSFITHLLLICVLYYFGFLRALAV